MAARGLAQGTLPFLLHNSMLYQCIFYVLVDCLNHLLPCNLIILWVRKSAVVKPIRIQKSSSNPVQYAYSSGKLHQGLWGSGIKCWNLTELHIHTSIIILKRSAACLLACLPDCLSVSLSSRVIPLKLDFKLPEADGRELSMKRHIYTLVHCMYMHKCMYICI